MKKIRPMKTANSCRDGIQDRILCQLEIANAEIPWTSVETEANMHGLYVDLDVPAVKLPMLNQSMSHFRDVGSNQIDCEITAYASGRLSTSSDSTLR